MSTDLTPGMDVTPPIDNEQPAAEQVIAPGVEVEKKNIFDDYEVETDELPPTMQVEQPAPVEKETPVEIPEADVPVKEPEPIEDPIYPVEDGTLKIQGDVYKLIDSKTGVQSGMVLLNTTREDFNNKTERMSEEESNNMEILPFLLTGTSAQDTAYPGEGLIKATTRIGSRWRQYLTQANDSTQLGPRRHRFALTKEQGAVVSGHGAVDLFMAGTNLGRSVQIPLWHSGFWVTLRAPTGAYLAEIDRALAFSREEIGLDTNGAVGSNDALVFDEVLLDSALKLVTSSTLPFSKNPLELKEFIAKNDIPVLIWGMAMAAFPDGTPIAIPCAECHDVQTVHANPLRMFWVDESRFTAKQLAHMGRTNKVQTKVEDLVKYHEEFEILNTANWEYNGRVFYFNDPSADEYLVRGREWISSINRALSESLRSQYDDAEHRAAAVQSALSTEDLCRFAHYIKEIKVPSQDHEGGYYLIQDMPTIIDVLRQLAADAKGSMELMVAINDFVNDSIGALVGFPNVACPSCGKYHLNKKGESTVIVPFNPATGFFTLAQHRIRVSGGIPLTNLQTLGVSALVTRVSESGLPV
ncbi:hypothetical protein 2050HW_00005 [Serratia phage vB_SmaM_ 2050HW]|uniref:Uncharacterized protein n=1 Tax=Serratia phage vB_SmaM_ 2050HW TaxID=2024252 RepID=A0A289ZVD8_9CAUD|nr:hypothetical protein HWB23_gp005 [Serratia phage vB_SmaM_ 2050HW]ATA65340.1 hypothetical protein 2050HW_00005 [Serratia phage vB_SmaM_ 2050HW]UCR74630.1 hypothetical protein [Serratia phage BUCT660]URG14197.1 hypothetical protein [Pectobacterium phage vB_ParM-25]